MTEDATQTYIYLDAAATTPCYPEVVAAMEAFMARQFGNPSSVHAMGRIAKHAVENALTKLAEMMECAVEELTITSGATESNNIIVLGTAYANEMHNIIVCPIDHKSTLEAASEMGRRGIDIRHMRVDQEGRIDLGHLRSLIDERTALVSLAYVNSEIGVIQDVPAIAEILQHSNAFLHLDATQAAGKMTISVSKMPRVDGMSVSAHKIGGPKGVGALFVRRGARTRPRPLTFGGGQFSLRSGTLPTQLIVGFGAAVDRLLAVELEERLVACHYRQAIILKTFEEKNLTFFRNSPHSNSVPSIINISFAGVRSETVIKGTPRVCVSSGSACNAKNLAPSYVLKSIGLDDDRANSAIRLSFQPETPIEHVEEGARLIAEKVSNLQNLTQMGTRHVSK